MASSRNEMEPRLEEKEGAQRRGYKGVNLIWMSAARWGVHQLTSTGGRDRRNRRLHSLIAQRGWRHQHGSPPPDARAMMKEIPSDGQFWAANTGGSIKLPFEENRQSANVNKAPTIVQRGNVYFDLRTGLDGQRAGEMFERGRRASRCA